MNSEDSPVRWIGFVDDTPKLIANCDVMILPSYREGFSQSLVEALAMGRPIITSDAPGCRATVTNGENGFLVPIRNSSKLVEAMLKFIREKNKIPVMGAKSRTIAENKYDVHKVNQVMLKIMGL